MNMRQRIEQIFELLAKIPVAGESVDIMAAVRAELRALHKIVRANEIQRDSQAKCALESDIDLKNREEGHDG